MTKKPFLMNFKEEVPCIDPDLIHVDDTYSEELQMRILADGSLVWNALSRKYPTSCWTAGHRTKAGYTKKGKYKPSRYIKGKTDKRGGK